MVSEKARRGAVALFGVVAALLYWSPALWQWDATGFGDWQQFQHQWEAGYAAVMRYGEFPLWNPHHCGGVFLFDDPQAQIYSPLFWVFFPFGPTVGLKLFLVTHAAIGFAGMYVFARRQLSVGQSAALFASICWAGSGFFAWRGSGGHAAFLPFYFTPWLLLAWRRAAYDVRYGAAVAAWMGLTLLEGGVYPFPFFCLLLTFDALTRMSSRAEAWKVIKAGLITVPLILTTSGFRLLPILDSMKRYPRPLNGDVCVPSSWVACLGSAFYPPDKLTFSEVAKMLTDRDYDYRFAGHEYVWAEYGAFIGITAAVIIGIGLVPAWTRRRSLVVGALLFGWLMMGSVTDWSPWPLLHRMPVFDSLRVPSRFVVFFLFFASLIGALVLDRVVRLLPRPGVRAMVATLPLLVAAEIAWGNGAVIDRWRGDPIPPMAPAGHHHLLSAGEYGRYATFPALDVGNPACYTGMAYEAARALWVGPSPQARVEDNAGSVLSVRRNEQLDHRDGSDDA